MIQAMNTVLQRLSRRLRLAVIGGGPGSFIGGVHRQAARLDDCYTLVAAALSSDAQKSRDSGLTLGLPAERSYSSGMELLEAESQRCDGAEVVAIMTPNDSHFALAMQALDCGLHVICDKPMTATLEQAQALYQRVQESGLVFCLTHNYSGYPLVRQARAMVLEGQLGEIRLVQVEYVQGGRATSGPARKAWKNDPVRTGPSLVLGDIGTHAHQLLCFMTGLDVAEVAADVGQVVPGRSSDDYAGALLRMRNGARGSFWVTQAAAGVENGLRIRISGDKGTLEWHQEHPQQLCFKPLGAPAQIRTPNGPGTLALAARASRIAAGHPEGFTQAFANLYTDVAEVIASRLCAAAPDPLALHFPDASSGLAGQRFVEAALRSTRNNGQWTAL
jgi:predicted dehydrogenase